MSFKTLKYLIISVSCGFVQSGQANLPIILYEKALRQKKHIDISAVFSGSYGEVRWDVDGDGIIDNWLFSKGNIRVKEVFESGKLSEVLINKNDTNHSIHLFYKVDTNHQLKLTHASIVPYRTYFNEQDNSVMSMLDGDACSTPPITKYTKTAAWKELICNTTEVALNESQKEMVSQSCSQNHSEIVKGLKSTYGLKLSGDVEENKVLNCLSSSDITVDLVPSYLQSIGADIFSNPKLQIECVKYSGPGCGKASYDPQTRKIKLPIKDPPCSANMSDVFAQNIVHETFHRVALNTLSESAVQGIVEACMNGKKDGLAAVKRELHSPMVGKEFSINGEAKTKQTSSNLNNSNLQLPAQTRELAAQPANIIATAGERSGTLNSGFRSIASAGDSFNPNQAYRESVARTGSVFPKFEAAVNAIVPPASAGAMTWVASTSGGSSKSSSSGGGQWLTDSASTGSQSGVLAQGADIEESRGKRSPSSVGETDVSSAATGPSQKANSRSQREVVNGTTRSGGADGMRSSGRAPNVAISNGSTSTAGESEAQEKKRASLSPQQKQQAVQLVNSINSAKNPNEVLALLQKNDSRLATLKVHVYDPKAAGSRQPAGQKAGNRKDHYGASQDEAAEFYSLINGKLVPE